VQGATLPCADSEKCTHPLNLLVLCPAHYTYSYNYGASKGSLTHWTYIFSGSVCMCLCQFSAIVFSGHKSTHHKLWSCHNEYGQTDCGRLVTMRTRPQVANHGRVNFSFIRLDYDIMVEATHLFALRQLQQIVAAGCFPFSSNHIIGNTSYGTKQDKIRIIVAVDHSSVLELTHSRTG